MSFGQNLQFLRKTRNAMTQEELAERLKVSRQTVSKWELDTSYPEMDTVLELCQLFSCSMDELVRGDMAVSRENFVYRKTNEKLDSSLGKRIKMYRTRKDISLEDMAAQLNVTPEVAAGWEEGKDAPYTAMIDSICSVLGITEDALFGRIRAVYKDQNNYYVNYYSSGDWISEPLMIEFGNALIPTVCDGLESHWIDEARYSLLRRKGYLMPVVRVRDNMELEENGYQILIYGCVVKSGTIESIEIDSYKMIFGDAVSLCEENYADIINKSLVKALLDKLKEKYPVEIDGIIPERISYLQVLRYLQEKIREGREINDLIHLLEELEDKYSC